jgi:hypothetical protein
LTVELVIRDGSPDWWESPDIWVVPGTNPDAIAGTPVVGQPAYLWATVRNEGNVDVSQVQVDFWIANPSLQIRKSTANHVGSAFADVAAASSQDVLCLVPWNVMLVNGGHECVVVEASSPLDPLNPPPTDPDILDAPTYRHIAQRNLSVAYMTGSARTEVVIAVSAGARADKVVEVEVIEGRELSEEQLTSLGLKVRRYIGSNTITAALSEHSLCGEDLKESRSLLRLNVPRGTSSAAHLGLATQVRLARDEYSVIRVVERVGQKVIGGLSIVVVQADDHTGGQ